MRVKLFPLTGTKTPRRTAKNILISHCRERFNQAFLLSLLETRVHMTNARFFADDSSWMRNSQAFILLLLEDLRNVLWLLLYPSFLFWRVGVFLFNSTPPNVVILKSSQSSTWVLKKQTKKALTIPVTSSLPDLFDYLQLLWQLIHSFKSHSVRWQILY